MLTAPYRILRYRDWPCLLCLVCNKITHNPHDIAEHYCGHCQQFLAALPPDYPGDVTEGRSPGPLLHGEDDAAPGALPWERPAFPPVHHRMPWDKQVPPAIAGCPLCDTHGFVEVWDGQGTLVLLRCPHDSVRLRACATRHGYQLVREDRSREPPLPAAQEGGPGA